MKKIFVFVITFLVIGLAVVSAIGNQDSAPAATGQNYDGNNTPAITQQRPVVAVALFSPFSDGTSEEAAMIKRTFCTLLENTGQVELRSEAFVDQVLREHNLNSPNAAGWSDTAKKAAFGRALNASWIIQGTVQELGDNLLVDIWIYDQNFDWIESTYVFFPPTDDPVGHIQPLVDYLVDAIDRGAKSYMAYRIGGIGPAGGIIFYMKNDNKDGWRCLEAAPYDLGPAQWGAYELYVTTGYGYYGVNKEIGTGKSNTSMIVEGLNSAGETNCAAQLCADYELNGFNDWFLPSIDELREMYSWLIDINSGGHKDTFQHDAYWTSTEVNDLHAVVMGFRGEYAGAWMNFNEKTRMFGVRPIRAF